MVIWSQTRIINGRRYTAEVRPTYRQYEHASIWSGYYDWAIMFENAYRPRIVCGTVRGDRPAINTARTALTYLCED